MAALISGELLLYCLVIGSIYLLASTIILESVGKLLKVNKRLPSELVEQTNLGWYVVNFLMEALFFVAIPTLAYSFAYVIMPLSGVRSGMAAALFAFTLGALPIAMSISVRIRLPMPFLMFQLLNHLIKLGGALALIGYLYSL